MNFLFIKIHVITGKVAFKKTIGTNIKVWGHRIWLSLGRHTKYNPVYANEFITVHSSVFS